MLERQPVHRALQPLVEQGYGLTHVRASLECSINLVSSPSPQTLFIVFPNAQRTLQNNKQSPSYPPPTSSYLAPTS